MAGIAFPRRGEVYWASLDPVVGTEMAKTRPAVIISNDAGNQYSRRVIVAPLTSVGVHRAYRFEVPIAAGEGGLPQACKIALDQIRVADKRHLGRRLGALSTARMAEVDRAIRLSLAV